VVFVVCVFVWVCAGVKQIHGLTFMINANPFR
jgi:hypothetical protein